MTSHTESPERPVIPMGLHIFVDADSCPVKDEIYKVAIRHQTSVSVVANNFMQVPANNLFRRIHVSSDFDAADDFIAERANSKTIVVTADILLAQRCLKTEATVIAPNGKLFTVNSIGAAVATRAIMEDLRAGGEQCGGPPPFAKADRSRFLSALHEAISRLKRSV